MTAFSNYADAMLAAVEQIEEDAIEIRSNATGKLFRSVVAATPVLTTYLRSNWQATSGDVPWSEVPIRPLSEVLAEIEQAITTAKDDEPLFLTNNTVYGPRIEYDGWSGKAPQGMMRINATRWPAFVDEAASELGSK